MSIKVADEVWIATALLHQENPEQESFSSSEIIDRVAKENLFGRMRPGVLIHVSIHCVANKKPNPGTYKMLYATEDRKRRLFKDKDDFHSWREGGKIHPKYEDIPAKYHYLIIWWENEYNKE
jgi:hypothetical protein